MSFPRFFAPVGQNGEFEFIEMECAVKQTSPLVGKTQRNKMRGLKEAQAAPYENQIRAMNFARGACGSVLCAVPLFSERLGRIFYSYNDHFSTAKSNQADLPHLVERAGR